MLKMFQPIRDSNLLYSGFHEKTVYKVRRAYKLTTKQLTILIQCKLMQEYSNGLFTEDGLRPIVPCANWDIRRYVTVLQSKGLIDEIEPAFRRNTSKGIKKNVFYTLSNTGHECMNMFNRVLMDQVTKFKNSKKWKRINPQAMKHFESLGIIDYSRQRDSTKRSRLRPPDGLNS